MTIGAGVYDGTNATAVATNLAITDRRGGGTGRDDRTDAEHAIAAGDAGDADVTEHTILDDDTVTAEFDTASSSDDENVGGNLAVLLVTGEVQTGYSVDVSVDGDGGTASPADYANTATVTIGGGVYDGTVDTAVATNLAITDDTVVEPDETIELTLRHGLAAGDAGERERRRNESGPPRVHDHQQRHSQNHRQRRDGVRGDGRKSIDGVRVYGDRGQRRTRRIQLNYNAIRTAVTRGG